MKKRISGKPFAIGLVAVLVVVLAVVMVRWKQTRWPEGRTIGVSAASGERAFVLLHAATQPYAGYLLCVERERGPIWDAAIYGLQLESGRAVTVLAGDLVTVRAKDAEGHRETFAFNQQDGVYQWHGGRAREDAEVPDDGPITFVRPVSTARVLAELYVGPHPELVGIHIADGSEAYRVALPLTLEEGRRVVAEQQDDLVMLRNPTTGESHAFEIETGRPSNDWMISMSLRPTPKIAERHLRTGAHCYAVEENATLIALDPQAETTNAYAFRSGQLLGRIERSTGEITNLAEISGPFELRPQQLAIGEPLLWIATDDGVRALHPSSLRPLRGYSSVPTVRDRTEERAAVFPQVPCLE